MDDFLDTPRTATPVNAVDVEVVLDEICANDLDLGWTRDVEIDLGAKRWRPSAVAADQSSILYVLLLSEFPAFVVERLRLCRAAGMDICVALSVSALFQADVLELLVELEAEVLVVDDYNRERQREKRHILTALADIEVPLSAEVRRRIGSHLWSRLGCGSSQEKGRRLEGLLAFLFSQVRDLKVVERNYRNETEEIDLVLQVDNVSPRVWQNPGVPFILVEAKNRADKASQAMVSLLITKLQTKRGASKIGILVSIGGFTDDAKIQELRFSTENICVVMIDGAGVEALLGSEDLDDALEVLVRRALLR